MNRIDVAELSICFSVPRDLGYVCFCVEKSDRNFVGVRTFSVLLKGVVPGRGLLRFDRTLYCVKSLILRFSFRSEHGNGNKYVYFAVRPIRNVDCESLNVCVRRAKACYGIRNG